MPVLTPLGSSQNIGNFNVEPSFEKFQSAFKDGYEVTRDEIKERYEEGVNAAKAAAEKVAEETKKAAEEARKAAEATASSATGGGDKKGA